MLLFAAVITYDWLLTLPNEIHIIWKHPVKGANILYIVNRYSYIVFYVLSMPVEFVPILSNKVNLDAVIEYLDSDAPFRGLLERQMLSGSLLLYVADVCWYVVVRNLEMRQ